MATKKSLVKKNDRVPGLHILKGNGGGGKFWTGSVAENKEKLATSEIINTLSNARKNLRAQAIAFRNAMEMDDTGVTWLKVHTPGGTIERISLD